MASTRERAEPAGFRVTKLDTIGTTVTLSLAGSGSIGVVAELLAAVATVALAAGMRLELRLADLHSCDGEFAWELLEFVRDVKDIGGHVCIADRPSSIVSAVLALADVRGDLALATSPTGDGSTPPVMPPTVEA